MSTTHCETNIVRIRVGLFNDILSLLALRIFFNFFFSIIYYDLTVRQRVVVYVIYIYLYCVIT